MKQLKHLKTFESFALNEESIFAGMWDKLKSSYTGWKDERMETLSEYVKQAILDNKDNPEMIDVLKRINKEVLKIDDEDQMAIGELVAKGEVPELDGVNEEFKLISKFLKKFARASSATGISLFVAKFIQIISVGDAYNDLFGINNKQLILAIIILLASGVLTGVINTVLKTEDK